MTKSKFNFFIFDGIEDAFEEHWKLHEDVEDLKYKRIRKQSLIKWVKEYCKLYRSIIPKNKVSCMVETKQQYEDFSLDEIFHVLKTIGELSNKMYCAGRDVLVCNSTLDPGTYYPLQKYYEYALEQVVWLVASFNQGGSPKSFTDLKNRFQKLIVKTA